ncbi:hypothetical protein CK203_100926 [Vitis vinifera]|uniref:Tf2-1-like SH3-like domain-containing protein n=1 Tax=Vitis vinifera TaxID=29760 RepID=A0A438CJE8_VITVI|nr:hypothetical protein CK203_100926 [Vitis vinifera]
MKKWADKKRRHTEYKVEDMMLVKLLPQQFKSLRSVHKGLVKRYEGPFPILRKVGKVSYRVELPPRLKIHLVFHTSYSKPYHGDKDDPSRGLSKRAPTAVVTSYDKEKARLVGSQRMHYGNSRSRLGGSGQKARRGRLRHKWGECHKLIQMSLPMALYRAKKLLETPRMGRVWKVLEKTGRIHTILHYDGRHERSLGLSRQFQKSLVYTCEGLIWPRHQASELPSTCKGFLELIKLPFFKELPTKLLKLLSRERLNLAS